MAWEMPPYDKLVKKYHQRIFYYCRRLLKDDWATAEDITSEVFVKMWQKYLEFASEENVKAFLYLVARNACFNELQRIKRQHTVDIDLPIFEAWLFEMPKYEMVVIEAEVIAFIKEEIQKLPRGMREAITGLLSGDNSTIAAGKLGITRKTILNQKLKTIKYLRKQVQLKFGI
jgi:RNA polymerase sigma-70 factor (ECF subfamily)